METGNACTLKDIERHRITQLLFVAKGSESQAEASIQTSKKPIADNLQKQIKGKKMVMVINLSSVKDDKISTLTSFIQPILGKLNSIVYTLK